MRSDTLWVEIAPSWTRAQWAARPVGPTRRIVRHTGPEGTRTYAYDPQRHLTDVLDGQENPVGYYRYTAVEPNLPCNG